VQSIPNFIVFQNGRPVMQRAGLAPKTEMRKWIEDAELTLTR
jgi:thioredoxin-like negative regulator of GroEL